jgi:hypothetical protein
MRRRIADRFSDRKENSIFKIVLLFYFVVGIIGCWKIGTYADANADATLAKYNFGKLFGISRFTEGYDPSFDTYVASYGYSIALFVFGPSWIFTKLMHPTIGMQDDAPMFIRNILSFTIGIIGVVAVYKWGQIVLKPKLHFLPLLLPLFVPTLFGNFFMNSKDVPLFTGFCSFIYVFALLLDNSRPTKIKPREILPWVFVALVFTVGVRPISIAWIAPPLILLIYLIYRRNSMQLKYLMLGIFVSSLYIVVSNFFLLTDPIFWVSNNFQTGQNFPWMGAVLSWGELYTSPNIPGRYLLEMLIAQLPLLTLFSIPLFIYGNKKRLLPSIRKSPVSVKIAGFLFIQIILQSIILEPVIYDNGRQLLFIWGLAFMIAIWLYSETSESIFKSKTLLAIITMFSTVSIVDQIGIFPYNYIYRNEIARTLPQGNFETDYWGISGKEMTEWVINDSKKDGNHSATFAYIFTQSYVPYLNKSSLISVSTGDLTAKYYSQIWRPGLLPDFSAQCPIVYSVERAFFLGKNEILGYVRKC